MSEYFRPLTSDAAENFLHNFVRRGQTVFDVGANVGQSALLAADLAGPEGRVISFEPNPASCLRLRAAVEASGHRNIKVLCLALAEKPGTADFFVDTRPEFTAVASSLRELDDLAAAGQSCRTTVECTTLDLYCAENRVFPNILKIDVESAEPLVISGGRRTIERHRPVILFEFWETWWNRGFRELFSYLRPMYRLIRMQDGADVDTFYETNSGTLAVDILCLPKRRWFLSRFRG